MWVSGKRLAAAVNRSRAQSPRDEATMQTLGMGTPKVCVAEVYTSLAPAYALSNKGSRSLMLRVTELIL